MTILNTITLALSGESVSLEDFAHSIERLYNLVKGLSAEQGGEQIDWIISDLQISSAVATVKGLGTPERVERVVRAYTNVGDALAEGRVIPFSPRVQKSASALTKVLKRRVEGIRFETAEREIIIRRSIDKQTGKILPLHHGFPLAPQSPYSAFGSIEGRIQTLTNRGELRFTLYDLLHDKAVSCYLREGQEDIMRDAWGKLASVAGVISRDPITGRPLSVRQVSDVIIRPDAKGSYRDARGCSPSSSDLSPEAAIRKLRDA